MEKRHRPAPSEDSVLSVCKKRSAVKEDLMSAVECLKDIGLFRLAPYQEAGGTGPAGAGPHGIHPWNPGEILQKASGLRLHRRESG